MKKRFQAKHLTDLQVLFAIDTLRGDEKRWIHRWELSAKLPIPIEAQGERDKVLLAKVSSMIRRKLLGGCTCGCGGGFYVEPAGEEILRLKREHCHAGMDGDCFGSPVPNS